MPQGAQDILDIQKEEPSVAVKAKYTRCSFPLHRGNPLIETLPDYPAETNQSIVDKLKRLPKNPFTLPSRRQKSMWLVLVSNSLFIPLVRHYDLFEVLDTMIREGYRCRLNRLANVREAYLNQLEESGEELDDFIKDNLNDNEHTTLPMTVAVVGCSGIGKTRAVDRVLSLYQQVYVHDSIQGIRNFTQIVYLKVECPHDGSVKVLCTNIISAISSLTGFNYDHLTHSRSTLALLSSATERLLKQYNVGILIIDEIQNLMTSRMEREQLFNFIVSMSNKLNVPMMFVGTPKIQKLMETDLRVSRRFSTLGVRDWEPLRFGSYDWNAFITNLWQYYILPEPASKEDINKLMLCLFEYSQGITDLVVKLFVLSQMRAMVLRLKGIECGLIKEIFETYFKTVKPMIMAIKNNDLKALEKYEDIKMSEREYDGIIKKMKTEIDTAEDAECSAEELSIQRITGTMAGTPYAEDAKYKAALIELFQLKYPGQEPSDEKIAEMLANMAPAEQTAAATEPAQQSDPQDDLEAQNEQNDQDEQESSIETVDADDIDDLTEL